LVLAQSLFLPEEGLFLRGKGLPFSRSSEPTLLTCTRTISSIEIFVQGVAQMSRPQGYHWCVESHGR
jgi:hypothetical protein